MAVGVEEGVARPARSVDKAKLKQRLESLQVVPEVLPTRPLQGQAVTAMVESIREGRLDNAETALRGAFQGEGLSRETTAGALEQLATSEALHEQVRGFAAAGLGFVRAQASYLGLRLADRVAMGGNAAVTRVVKSEERLLLETQRLNVRFHADTTLDYRQELLRKYSLVPIRPLTFTPGLVQVVSETMPAAEVALRLLEEQAVEHANPDFIEFIGQRYRPADPEYGLQWHLRNAANAGADIHAEAAWDITKGAGVRIAVVDNGFDVAHPDLAFGPGSAWFRSTPGFASADFVLGTFGMPNVNHGTACAGMAAAREGNGAGGCGAAFEADLLAIGCLGDQVGPQSTLARAIAYAADPSREPTSGLRPEDGADVIACSLGPNGAQWLMQPVLEDAIDFAVSSGRGGKGTPVFWATTNGDFPISADEVCSHNPVFAVGRSTRTDTDNGSGYGPELALLAPGVNVHLPRSGGGYAVTTGTSFACPCAAGVGGLVLAINAGLSASDVADILRATCDKKGVLPYVNERNDRFGHGRINAERAVTSARSYVPTANRFHVLGSPQLVT